MKTQKFIIDIAMPEGDAVTKSALISMFNSEFCEDISEGRWKVKVEEVESVTWPQSHEGK